MRFTLFITLTCLAIGITYANDANSQTKKTTTNLNLSFKNTSIVNVIEAISKKTGYSFFYDEAALPHTDVSINMENATLQQVLDQITRQTNLRFHKVDETYTVVPPSDEPKLASAAQQPSGIRISGTVSDNLGNSIPGANVIVRGTKLMVVTDANGEYSIMVPSDTSVLQFSFVGLSPQEVSVGSKRIIAVTLHGETTDLDEVTVVAFARQKKESVISSVSSIKPTELKMPSSNLTSAFAGRMSGIIAYQRSGEPGQDNAQFFIRGITTFGSNKNPLILIDNIELSSEDLSRLNVDDIASFSVMKDATATALYGARGANGVILVTTKEGKEGKARVSFRLENSVSLPAQMVELADPITYMQLNNEAVVTRNPLGIAPFPQSKIDNTVAGANQYVFPAQNWYEELFNKYTMNQRANISVNGGGTIAKYYVAAAYMRDNGVLKTDNLNSFNSNINLQKYTVRSNINIDLTKTTEVIIRVQGNFDDYSGPLDGGSDLFSMVMKSSPVLFPKTFPRTGEYANIKHTMYGNSGDGSFINPYARMTRGYKEYNRALMVAQVELKQKFDFITKGLNARALVSTTRYSYSDVYRYFTPTYYTVPQNGYNKTTDTYTLLEINKDGTNFLDYSEGAKDVSTTNYTELSVDYNREFGKHGMSGMLVYVLQDRKISNAGDLQRSLPYRNQGLSGRFTYSYGKRYFAEFNFGYNGSERFSKKERYGFFPSIGFGYLVSNESFWESLENTVNKLKLKFTYGLVGNDAIGSDSDRFFYMSKVQMQDGGKQQSFGKDYDFEPNGITVERYANDKITWETARKINFGLEIGLFKNLELQADLFYEYRTNILMDRVIPSTMGLTGNGVRANTGEASSKGMDMSLEYSYMSKNSFWLTGRANFTYAAGHYEVYEEPDYASQGMGYRSIVGQNLNSVWGLVAERLFVDEADIANAPTQNFGLYQAGDIKYKDVNRDGRITGSDEVFQGFPSSPQITYGFGVSAGYKGFDISMFFQGNARVSFWINPNKITPFIDSERNGSYTATNALMKIIADNHWSESDRNIYAFWPRLANQEIANNTRTSTWWMQNGTFLRMKSLEIGYSFPRRWVNAIRLGEVRIYLSGSNLFTISKFKLWDPEMGDNGLGYPIQRVYNVGLTLNF
ncbi:MAG: TonB-dependent receptor [Prevotellaceae bacterium]|nr:TonB-dependent receptor [Prevotellaceae bacterium]